MRHFFDYSQVMKTSLIALSLCLISPSFAASKAIFGGDQRREIYQSPRKIQKMASGLANWTSPLFMEDVDQDTFRLTFEKMEDHYGLCKDEKFSQQPTAMISCTGFLVAPDLLMTAGHCMVNIGTANDEVVPMCSDFNWLFDYYYQTPNQNLLLTKKENVLGCEKVLFARHTGEYEQRKDFALIKLTKPLTKRHIFKLSDKKIRRGMTVSLMGFGSGLPLKYSQNSVVTQDSSANFYEATVDAVGGNSGSPVLDFNGNVIGILVRGNDDFAHDREAGCDRWNKCSARGNSCTDGIQEDDFDSGMHIQRITPELLKEVQKFL